MATNYTTLLGLAQPTTGELAGTWGDTVNNYITTYLDAAVADAQVISGSQTAVTLSKTTGAALTQAAAGATGSSQYQIINCTGNPAATLVVTVPSAYKTYYVLNSTSTSQAVTIKGAATTGVTIPAGGRALVSWNGSDFVVVSENRPFPAGTVLLFYQASAPTGWTQVTTQNNKALRVVSGTGGGTGGTVAFTTAFASQTPSGTVGSTTISTTQMPSHSHTYTFASPATPNNLTGFATTTGNSKSVGTGSAFINSTGGGSSHNHTFAGTAIDLSVQYIDIIIASKN